MINTHDHHDHEGDENNLFHFNPSSMVHTASIAKEGRLYRAKSTENFGK